MNTCQHSASATQTHTTNTKYLSYPILPIVLYDRPTKGIGHRVVELGEGFLYEVPRPVCAQSVRACVQSVRRTRTRHAQENSICLPHAGRDRHAIVARLSCGVQLRIGPWPRLCRRLNWVIHCCPIQEVLAGLMQFGSRVAISP
jgi:hypothetical protein